MTGSAAMCFCMLVAAAVFTAQPNSQTASKVLLAFVVIYIFAYTASISPYAWLCAGEIPSQRLRHYTVGLAAAFGFFSCLADFLHSSLLLVTNGLELVC